jgi:hypothetical protein
MTRSNEDPKDRIALMLAAIADVAPPGHPLPRGIDRASEKHRRLFEEYLPALERSRHKAEARWNGLVLGLMERTGKTRERALRDLRASKPAGRAAHVEFIGTVRRYWLKCANLNETMPEHERVPPEEFILEWPAATGADACVDTLTEFTYFPVGLNEEGRWV